MSKLREKINALVPIEFGGMQEPLLTELEQITDDFAGKFAEWISQSEFSPWDERGIYLGNNNYRSVMNKNRYTTTELLQIFKEKYYE
jgi:hypothetical protein